MKKNKIGKKLCGLLPFTPSYILRLLPLEYKEEKYSVLRKGKPKPKNGPPVEPVQRQGNPGQDEPAQTATLDRETKCQACGAKSTRADLKQTLLCKECRRKLNMKW